MTIQDFRNLEPGASLDVDVCIIGSGPAGWTIAEELRDTGIKVLVLESGGVLESDVDDREAEIEALNATEDIGVPLFNGRRRTLGGTPESIPWGNRCIAFDPIDYRPRSWVPFSGWPFDEAEISPYLDRASRHLGAGLYLPGGPVPCGVEKPQVDPEKLVNVCWSFGHDPEGKTVRYGRLFRQRRHRDLRVLVHATVTHLNTNPEGTRIESVEIGHPEGHRTTVTARKVVLCTGGIENPRVLLYSNRTVPRGIGNAHGLVGRFLMDHPRDLGMAITFDPKAVGTIRRLFGPYRSRNDGRPREFVGGLALPEGMQQREGLLNCAAWPVEEVADDDPFAAALHILRRNKGTFARDVRNVTANPLMLLRSLQAWATREQPIRSKISKVGFHIGSEQRPDPESRVTLTNRLDPLGLPIARTDWRVGAEDRESQAVLAKTIAAEFRRLCLPEARLADWIRNDRHAGAIISDGCHPTATTRMSDHPAMGVVDPDCQVHGVNGLFVAGSSVFPTAGHANPTLMIVAMAVRLAENLKEQLRITSHRIAQPAMSSAAVTG